MQLEELLGKMVEAAKGVAGKEWPKISRYAENEFRLLAESAISIEARKQSGQITEIDARFLMRQHKNAAESVLFAVEGLTNLMVEEMINAAIRILRDTVNTAIGWTVI